MMGMRLSEGLDIDRFEKIADSPLPGARIAYLKDLGMIALSATG